MIAKSILFKNPDLFKLISKVYSESMKVEVFSDGSCIGNPGPGGWAALVRAGKMAYRIQGGEPYTTNNRMEMLGSIWGIKTAMAEFPDFTEISVTTDSSLIVDTMNKNWKKKKNQDLWEDLAKLIKGHKVTWHWVRGHNGHKENEDCDSRATAESAKQQKIFRKGGGAMAFHKDANTLF